MYKTHTEAARKGIITKEMESVAAKEYRTPEEIRELVAKGQAVICANRLHKCIKPNSVGSMLRTKINVNLGVSRDCKDYEVEMQKVMTAVNMGAEAIMDLSSHGNTQPFRQKLVAECPAMKQTLAETAPYCNVVTHTVKLKEDNLSLIADCDIVCECFDNTEYKAMLVNGVSEYYPENGIVKKCAVREYPKSLIGIYQAA